MTKDPKFVKVGTTMDYHTSETLERTNASYGNINIIPTIADVVTRANGTRGKVYHIEISDKYKLQILIDWDNSPYTRGKACDVNLLSGFTSELSMASSENGTYLGTATKPRAGDWVQNRITRLLGKVVYVEETEGFKPKLEIKWAKCFNSTSIEELSDDLILVHPYVEGKRELDSKKVWDMVGAYRRLGGFGVEETDIKGFSDYYDREEDPAIEDRVKENWDKAKKFMKDYTKAYVTTFAITVGAAYALSKGIKHFTKK